MNDYLYFAYFIFLMKMIKIQNVVHKALKEYTVIHEKKSMSESIEALLNG